MLTLQVIIFPSHVNSELILSPIFQTEEKGTFLLSRTNFQLTMDILLEMRRVSTCLSDMYSCIKGKRVPIPEQLSASPQVGVGSLGPYQRAGDSIERV